MSEARRILALDIGTKAEGSGLAYFKTWGTPREPIRADNTQILSLAIVPNSMIERQIDRGTCAGTEAVFEGISSYGNIQGRDIHRTLLWIGRLYGRWLSWCTSGEPCPAIVLAVTAKAHLTGKANAKDSLVAQAVRDRFGGMGATPKAVKGTKKSPGPLYGIKGDAYRALAVGIAFVEGAKTEDVWNTGATT